LVNRLSKASYLAKWMMLALLFISNVVFSWNALGHQLIAQIAYNQLTPQTKKLFNHYNQALNKNYSTSSLVNAAVWLDVVSYLNMRKLQPLHYIDIPFSTDGSKLLPPDSNNAVSAIEQAINTLKNSHASLCDKGFSTRILLHVIGDIHQPMHTISRYSKHLPKGDKGGNLFYLSHNGVANNLHGYWDNGGGWLRPRNKYTQANLNKKAIMINRKWPCNKIKQKTPQQWAQESWQIAVNKAYLINEKQKPDKHYRNMVKKLTEKRIAIAGCRLAFVLNSQAFSK